MVPVNYTEVERAFSNGAIYGFNLAELYASQQIVNAHVGFFNGQTAWEGNVEVFALTRHPKATRRNGLSFGELEQFITILELPPVKSIQDAVKVGVAYQVSKPSS